MMKSRFKDKMILLLTLLILFAAFCFYPVNVQQVAAETLQNGANSINTVAKVENFSFATKEQIPSTVIPGMDYPYGYVSLIHEFWGYDGNYNVVYSDENMVYISILNQNMSLLKTIEITKDLPIVGNAIQDKDGYYYIVYGKNDTATMQTVRDNSDIVLSIVKYDSSGIYKSELSLKGTQTARLDDLSLATKEPFNAGNCDIMIDSNGMLVLFYGRVMYGGHQSSHAVFVRTSTMTKMNYLAPYCSHSFDQKIIPTSDGGILTVDRGDAKHRGFYVTKGSIIVRNKKSSMVYESFLPFHFRSGYIYQQTYAKLGGVAELSNGYAISGVSEKTLSYSNAPDDTFNESRNVFLQVFSKNFTEASTNNPNVQLLQGDTRKAEDTYVASNNSCEKDAADYGVLWLTNYTGTTYASNPKMLPIGNDQMLIMWEKKEYKKGTSDQYVESCYMVVSSTGNIIIGETAIQDERLTEYGEPTYKDGCIYWTTSDGKSKNIVVHKLSIGKTMTAKVHVTSIKTDQDFVVAKAGEKTQIKVAISPENADNKKLRYEGYDKDLLTVDENGIITVKGIGASGLRIVPEDNEKAAINLTVYTTDTAPTSLKAVEVNTDYYSDYEIKLTWKKSLYAEEYDIYRSTQKDKGYSYIDSTDDLYYYDDTVTAGKQYYYKVVAHGYQMDGKNLNPMSSPVTIYLLDAPSYLEISKSSKASAELTWSKVKNASGYEIYSYDKSSKKYVLIKTITSNATTKFKKAGLKSGQTYQYKIRAYKKIGNVKYFSKFTNTVKVKM